MQKIEFRAMGCHMLALIDADSEQAMSLLGQTPAWFDEWEDALSRFRLSSELNSLNEHSGDGRWTSVSATLWQVLKTALQAAEFSQGLVTPTVLPAMAFIGYDRSFNVIRQMPTVVMRVSPPPAIVDWHAVEIDSARRTVRLPAGAQLDFGGVAKGWAAQQAAQRLAAAGPALVDAGGDIAVSGPRADGLAWPISVANPVAGAPDLALLAIASGCVATSGRDYRHWRNSAGADLHHLIDPRTGWPAQTDVLCASVVAAQAWMAEASAKTALLQGSAAGLAWLEMQAPAVQGGLLVLEDGQVLTTSGWPQIIWSEDESSHKPGQ